MCGYALSETPYGLIWPHGARPYATLGSVRQHPELGHVNDARVMVQGRVAAPGQVGELKLRNPAIMRGYYDMPAQSAEVLVDGWFRTGDLVVDDGTGTYTFVGRQKHVIRRRGEILSPLEVEAALEAHPAVAEAAVIGVPSELSEQDVKAFVVPVPGRQVDSAELHAFAGGRLARFKVPRYIEVVDDLPHTPTGRLATHLLPTARTSEEIDMEPPRPSTRPGPSVDEPDWLSTWIGSSSADRITVAGQDLPSEVMGRLTLTDLAYLLVTRHEPSAAQRRLLDAVLVSLADHGLTRARWRRASPTPVPPRPSRARWPPDCSARAACSSAPPVTPHSSSLTPWPTRRAPTTTRCAGRPPTRWPRAGRAGGGCRASGIPCTATSTRAPRGSTSWRATRASSVPTSACSS